MKLFAYWFLPSWNMYIYFSRRETGYLHGTSCLLIIASETQFIFIFFLVKLIVCCFSFVKFDTCWFLFVIHFWFIFCYLWIISSRDLMYLDLCLLEICYILFLLRDTCCMLIFSSRNLYIDFLHVFPPPVLFMKLFPCCFLFGKLK